MPQTKAHRQIYFIPEYSRSGWLGVKTAGQLEPDNRSFAQPRFLDPNSSGRPDDQRDSRIP